MKQLAELFKNIEAEIPEAVMHKQVTNIHYDSRKIVKGYLFVAVKGFKSDGHTYLPKVAESGAVAAVVEQINPHIALPQIVVQNTRRVMAELAYNFHKEQIDPLKLIGITGTNGKTSCGFLLQSILQEAQIPAGLIGTIAYYVAGKAIPAWNTTPEALDICGMLSEMSVSEHQAAVLEVSSHALALNRVDGLRFDVALFTNLSRDHLDFHKEEQAYFEAKAHLFELLKSGGSAVINLDDPYGKQLTESVKGKALTYGFAPAADVQIKNWSGDLSGLHIEMQIKGKLWSFKSKLIGAFNVMNITASVAAAVALGLEIRVILRGIERLEKVPGRLQALQVKSGVIAVIDYAHTPDALEKALQALKKINPGRLIVLFGAGGDRDKGKRPLMGKVAQANADLCIVTTDNPRTENPDAIIQDILQGMADNRERVVIVDRRQAIEYAVRTAQVGDTLLIAGKGHETYQDINGVKQEFDEMAIIKQAAARV